MRPRTLIVAPHFERSPQGRQLSVGFQSSEAGLGLYHAGRRPSAGTSRHRASASRCGLRAGSCPASKHVGSVDQEGRRDKLEPDGDILQGREVPLALDGIKLNTSPTDFYPLQSLQLSRFKGEKWELFEDILSNEAR